MAALAQVTLGDLLVLSVDSDPRLGAGLSAPIGSMAIQNDGLAKYSKTGLGDNDWAKDGSGSLVLPVPKVRLQSPFNGVQSSMQTAWSGEHVEVFNVPEIIAVDIPDALLAPELGLQLEILRYRRGGRHNSKSGYNGSGYVHPSHHVNGEHRDGTFWRGGRHNDHSNGYVPRPTEWSVTAKNQVISMSDIASFVRLVNVEYRDSTGNASAVKCFVPTYSCSKSVGNSKRHYAKVYTPSYFCWRYSIIDLSDPHGNRVSGAISRVVKMTHRRHPFKYLPVESAAIGKACCEVNPTFNDSQINCEFESNI